MKIVILVTMMFMTMTLVLCPSTLQAQTYSTVAHTCNGGQVIRGPSPEPIDWEGTFHDCLEPESWVGFDASAGRGMLQAMAHAVDAVAGEENFTGATGMVTAVMRFEDVLIEGPVGTVLAALRLDLHAALGVTSVGGSSTASVTIDILLGGNRAGGHADIEVGSDPRGIYDYGMLDGLLLSTPGGAAVDASIVTPPIVLPTNTTLVLDIVLSVSAAAYDPFLAAEALSHAGNTLSFPRDAPIFELPAGYSVNSTQAGITDNRWSPDVRVDATSWGVLKSRY